jgi:hypothetical protein
MIVALLCTAIINITVLFCLVNKTFGSAQSSILLFGASLPNFVRDLLEGGSLRTANVLLLITLLLELAETIRDKLGWLHSHFISTFNRKVNI